jgi:putative flippase GtrA
MLKTYLRYLFTGVLNTIFGVFIYLIFSQMGFNYTIALAFSTFVGVLFNYLTLSTIVFKTSNNIVLIKYFLNYLLIYCVSILLIYFLLKLGFDQNFSGAIVIVSMSLLNFYVLKRFVFI